MRKDFLNTYQRLAKTSKSNLNEIYCELTGDTTAALTKQEQQQQRERIAEFLASSDEDLRKLNGKKGTKFEEFWDEVNNLFFRI